METKAPAAHTPDINDTVKWMQLALHILRFRIQIQPTADLTALGCSQGQQTADTEGQL